MSVIVLTTMFPDDDAPYIGTFVKDTIGFFGSNKDVVYPGNIKREHKLRFYWTMYKEAMLRIPSSKTVVIHYPLFFLPLTVLSRLLRKKVVLVYHGGEFMDRPGRRANLLGIRRLIFRVNNHLANDLFVPSKYVADNYFLHWNTKVRIWYSGGISTRCNNREPENRQYDFAYFGRVDHEKGYDCYIASLESLSNQLVEHRKLSCLSVCRENSGSRTESRGCLTILHLPAISHAQVLERLRHCKFVVIPSRIESLCLLALEAANSGAIVIARRLPAIEETLGEYPIYFDVDSQLPDVLKRALSMSMEDRTEIVAGQRERVKQFDREILESEFRIDH